MDTSTLADVGLWQWVGIVALVAAVALVVAGFLQDAAEKKVRCGAAAACRLLAKVAPWRMLWSQMLKESLELAGTLSKRTNGFTVMVTGANRCVRGAPRRGAAAEIAVPLELCAVALAFTCASG